MVGSGADGSACERVEWEDVSHFFGKRVQGFEEEGVECMSGNKVYRYVGKEGREIVFSLPYSRCGLGYW